MNKIWEQSVTIPIAVAIVLAACIVAIGESYLSLGNAAIYLAMGLMLIIVIAAAYFSRLAEQQTEVELLGKSIWRQSIVIPIAVAIVLAACIVAIGESYLSLGNAAIYLAMGLMLIIVIVAAYASGQSENQGEHK